MITSSYPKFPETFLEGLDQIQGMDCFTHDILITFLDRFGDGPTRLTTSSILIPIFARLIGAAGGNREKPSLDSQDVDWCYQRASEMTEHLVWMLNDSTCISGSLANLIFCLQSQFHDQRRGGSSRQIEGYGQMEIDLIPMFPESLGFDLKLPKLGKKLRKTHRDQLLVIIQKLNETCLPLYREMNNISIMQLPTHHSFYQLVIATSPHRPGSHYNPNTDVITVKQALKIIERGIIWNSRKLSSQEGEDITWTTEAERYKAFHQTRTLITSKLAPSVWLAIYHTKQQPPLSRKRETALSSNQNFSFEEPLSTKKPCLVSNEINFALPPEIMESLFDCSLCHQPVFPSIYDS